MPAHIHPLPYEFATRLVMKVHLPSLPGSVSCDGSFSLPPCAESPFAQNRCYLLWHDVLHHVGRHYPSFIAHTGSCARPKPSCFLQPQLGQQVFAGCRKPLLGNGPSRRYLCNPYMVAWTLTPRRFPGAFTRFFPENIGLTLDLRRSAHRFIPTLQLQWGTHFEAAVIPLCSGPHVH